MLAARSVKACCKCLLISEQIFKESSNMMLYFFVVLIYGSLGYLYTCGSSWHSGMVFVQSKIKLLGDDFPFYWGDIFVSAIIVDLTNSYKEVYYHLTYGLYMRNQSGVFKNKLSEWLPLNTAYQLQILFLNPCEKMQQQLETIRPFGARDFKYDIWLTVWYLTGSIWLQNKCWVCL